MAKYTFTCQHTDFYGNNIDKIVYEKESDTLNSLLEAFENFLKGSGFVFDGVVDIVPHDENCNYAPESTGDTMVTTPWPYDNNTTATVHHEDRI
jgi:hypothetical protein